MKNRFLFHRSIPLFIVLALLIMPRVLDGQPTKVNFSGEWSYDASRSNSGQAQGQPQGPGPGGPGRAGMGGSGFQAKQDATSLTVERKMDAPDGTTRTLTSKYTFDGKECINSTGRGDSRSSVSWSPDGKELTIKTTRTIDRGGETRTINSTEVWSLTDPGTLTIEMTMSSAGGDRKMTSVYIKK